jgi:DNA repair protein RecN (Recombination protein N)
VLKELHIEDFAIIDDLHLTLEPGFNILTGETGAGKSILIDAVTLLLGSRADTTVLRLGAKRARVEGMFVLSHATQSALDELLTREGVDGDTPDIMWLSRELRDNGRNVARVNGRVVSLSLMREIAESLIDIHGQSEHLSLLRTPEHLRLLDRFAGLEDLRLQVSTLFREITAVRHELRHLLQTERERMQRIDLLRFQVHEIRSAKIVENEKDSLESELIRLNNAEQLTSLVSAVVSLLEDGTQEVPAVLDLLGRGQRHLSSLVRIDSILEPQANTLSDVVYTIEDLAKVMRDYLGIIEYNPKRLALVEDRLVLLRQLERKYGRNLVEVLTYADSAEKELETLENSDEHIAELVEREAVLLANCFALCDELSHARQDAAKTLIAGMEKELADLRMEGARLGIAFTWHMADDGLLLKEPIPSQIVVTSEGAQLIEPLPVERAAFNATGMDYVEFLVAPNVGEGLKPMTRIASGGETARLMLALKTVLSRADRTPTLIFDEIDQGIGGRIGAVVGAKLWRLTWECGQNLDNCHQVLCITHLPQLAGFGDVHFKVVKKVVQDRTVTQVVYLEKAARVEELAQMLGTRGTTAEQGALEILEQARLLKQLNTVSEL